MDDEEWPLVRGIFRLLDAVGRRKYPTEIYRDAQQAAERRGCTVLEALAAMEERLLLAPDPSPESAGGESRSARRPHSGRCCRHEAPSPERR